MGITVRWGNDAQNIIYYEYTGRWTWAEYREANEQAYTLAQSVQHPIYVIADFRKSNFLPDGAISGFRRSFDASRFTFDIAVLIFEGDFLRRLFDLFRKVYTYRGAKLFSAKTPDAAAEIIRKQLSQNG